MALVPSTPSLQEEVEQQSRRVGAGESKLPRPDGRVKGAEKGPHKAAGRGGGGEEGALPHMF